MGLHFFLKKTKQNQNENNNNFKNWLACLDDLNVTRSSSSDETGFVRGMCKFLTRSHEEPLSEEPGAIEAATDAAGASNKRDFFELASGMTKRVKGP